MHFGKIVKKTVQANGLSAEDFAFLLGRTTSEILHLYELEEWTSGDVKAASIALEYDFGKFLNSGLEYNFPGSEQAEKREFLLTIRYAKGKETLLQSWLSKIILIAKAIGLEVH